MIDRWQLPKGTIDKDESSREAAVREVREEGMEYQGDSKDGHDHEVDEIIFLPFEKAYARLTFKGDKEILRKAKEILERGSEGRQENLI